MDVKVKHALPYKLLGTIWDRVVCSPLHAHGMGCVQSNDGMVQPSIIMCRVMMAWCSHRSLSHTSEAGQTLRKAAHSDRR